MIRLDLKKEPCWLDLGHGARVHVRPCTTALVMAARAERHGLTLDGREDDVPNAGARTAGFLKALARLAIDGWEGHRGQRGQAGIRDPGGHGGPAGSLADRRGVRAALPWPGPSAGSGKKRLTALAAWHFGGGASYCRGCALQGRACAEGRPGPDSTQCPYHAHEPLTDAGWAAWDTVLRCQGQLRLSGNGMVLGLDLATGMTLGTALGHAPAALAELLPAGEAGLVRALNERLAQDA